MFADGLTAELDASAWTWPAVFQWLAEAGGISIDEMRRTFNCGIGFVIAVEAKDAARALDILQQQGERASVIGRVGSGAANRSATLFTSEKKSA
jgi:phosphoribosylformylglycinamidine cyclo-ligase